MITSACLVHDLPGARENVRRTAGSTLPRFRGLSGDHRSVRYGRMPAYADIESLLRVERGLLWVHAKKAQLNQFDWRRLTDSR